MKFCGFAMKSSCAKKRETDLCPASRTLYIIYRQPMVTIGTPSSTESPLFTWIAVTVPS